MSSTSPQRTSYSNGVKRRAELVDTAMEVFGSEGFQRLSLRQLAESMGTSHTILRHHFGSKDGLLQAVLVRRQEVERPWRDKLIAEVGALSATPEVLRHNATIRGIIQLDATLQSEAVSPNHPAHDYITTLNRDFLAGVRDDLEAEHRRGRLRDGLDLDLTARQIVALINGLQLSWLHDNSLDMAAAMTAYLDMLRPPLP